jgi:hypothetical protein
VGLPHGGPGSGALNLWSRRLDSYTEVLVGAEIFFTPASKTMKCTISRAGPWNTSGQRAVKRLLDLAGTWAGVGWVCSSQISPENPWHAWL